METTKTTRFCILNRKIDSIRIKLLVSNPLLAGGDFLLYSSNTKTKLEEFKLTSEFLKNGSYLLKTSIEELNKCYLSWEILYCSAKTAATEGAISIDIAQNDNPTKMTLPLKWQLLNIPPCKINNPARISGNLTFIVSESIK